MELWGDSSYQFSVKEIVYTGRENSLTDPELVSSGVQGRKAHYKEGCGALFSDSRTFKTKDVTLLTQALASPGFLAKFPT
jgi:hypothetical protein